MGQIAVPIVVMVSVAAALALLGVRFGSRLPRPVAIGICVFAVAVMIAHAVYLGDNLLLARLMPVADVIIWGNVQPLAAGLLAGLAWSTLGTPRWQRALLVTAVGVLALYRAYWPMAGACPPTQDTWFGDVCKQSTLSTCSAAAAATALRAVGIGASETEMATLCLTRQAGTTNLGLYRGLRRKTDDTAYAAEVFTGTVRQLVALPGPAIVSVGSAYRDGGRAWGPLVGNRHSVVVLGRTADGKIEVADPYTGRRQHYTEAALTAEWDGRAVRLGRR